MPHSEKYMYKFYEKSCAKCRIYICYDFECIDVKAKKCILVKKFFRIIIIIVGVEAAGYEILNIELEIRLGILIFTIFQCEYLYKN